MGRMATTGSLVTPGASIPPEAVRTGAALCLCFRTRRNRMPACCSRTGRVISMVMGARWPGARPMRRQSVFIGVAMFQATTAVRQRLASSELANSVQLFAIPVSISISSGVAFASTTSRRDLTWSRPNAIRVTGQYVQCGQAWGPVCRQCVPIWRSQWWRRSRVEVLFAGRFDDLFLASATALVVRGKPKRGFRWCAAHRSLSPLAEADAVLPRLRW